MNLEIPCYVWYLLVSRYLSIVIDAGANVGLYEHDVETGLND